MLPAGVILVSGISGDLVTDFLMTSDTMWVIQLTASRLNSAVKILTWDAFHGFIATSWRPAMIVTTLKTVQLKLEREG